MGQVKFYFMSHLGPSATTKGYPMDRPSTGIDALDELLSGLGVGDNVVWQAPDPADIEPFVEALLATAQGDTPLTYLSFRLPPAEVLARFGQVWDSKRFTLLDGWT